MLGTNSAGATSPDLDLDLELIPAVGEIECTGEVGTLEAILRHYAAMPEVVRRRQARHDEYWRTVLRATVETARADERARTLADDTRVPMWQVVAVVVLVSVGAAGVGVLAGAIAAD